jgi:hypothetical protein
LGIVAALVSGTATGVTASGPTGAGAEQQREQKTTKDAHDHFPGGDGMSAEF